MTTLYLRKSSGRSPWRYGLFLIPLVLTFACIMLGPTAQAVVPVPDGGYPGGNTAEGQRALLSLTTGGFNTAVGFLSLGSGTTNSFNTAIGAGALLANTANQNTATGAGALLSNTTGVNNTANGAFALFSNTTGSANTANGLQALFSNTTGYLNVADGVQALAANTTGTDNTATGFDALGLNTTGSNNTANGDRALQLNTAGGNNTASGLAALSQNTIGNGNIGLGINGGAALTTGDNNIDIANVGVAGESNTIRVGTGQTATYIAGISGVNQGTAAAVFINTTTGQLGTAPPSSSRRFKKEMKPMDKASEAIMALKPVTFHYKSDKTGTPQFGLIAEEVAEVNPDLVVRDENGEIYTVRYDAVNAMLLNEFLKEHRKNEEQEKTIAELKSGMMALATTVKEQAAQIQKVSAQLEASRPAPHVVNNP
jgi:hypothetical protein